MPMTYAESPAADGAGDSTQGADCQGDKSQRDIGPGQLAYVPLDICRSEMLEHLWIVVGFVLSWLFTTVATWTS